ncbi:MAG: glycoside hydrolase family 3 N-terminal domain-containing protein, partial [Solirubrobacteraceae bacterium]
EEKDAGEGRRAGERALSPAQRAQLEAAAPGLFARRSRALPASPGVRATLAQLSLERQVAQLFVAGFEGQYPRDPGFEALRRRDWGGVMLSSANFVDETQLTDLTGEVGVVARDAGHLAPIVAADQPGGPDSAFPDLPPRAQPLVGDSRSPAIARSQARKASAALRERGIRMTLAPVADVGTTAGPLQDRVFSDDAATVTAMTAQAVEAYRRGGVISAVGHFPGAGSASENPNFATASVGLSLPELRERDLRPFAAVAGRTPVIVVSNAVYAAYDGATPAVELPEVIGGLLRRELGFRGVVMTDDLEATALASGENVGTAAIGALRAGADVLYVSGGAAQERAYRAVLAAVRKGTISRERLRISVTRLLTLKQRFGLLPTPRQRPRPRARPPARPRVRPSAPATTPATPTPPVTRAR